MCSLICFSFFVLLFSGDNDGEMGDHWVWRATRSGRRGGSAERVAGRSQSAKWDLDRWTIGSQSTHQDVVINRRQLLQNQNFLRRWNAGILLLHRMPIDRGSQSPSSLGVTVLHGSTRRGCGLERCV